MQINFSPPKPPTTITLLLNPSTQASPQCFVPNDFVSSILSMWIITIGMGGVDTYPYRVRSWRLETYGPSGSIYFIIVSILVQLEKYFFKLVLLNLLIAIKIMSEAFSRLNEKKEQNSLKEKCKIMFEYSWLRFLYELYPDARYILLLAPDEGTLPLPATEKKLSQLRDYIEDKVEESDTMILDVASFEPS